MFYVATNIHGRGIKIITDFESRKDFYYYLDDVLACHNTTPLASDTIGDLCDKMYDNGPGTGARSHYRVSREEAKEYIRAGAANKTLLL